MARLLEKALRRSEAVDREALCLVAGQKVNYLSLSLSPSVRTPIMPPLLAHRSLLSLVKTSH